MTMRALSQLNTLLEERREEIPYLRDKGQKVFGYVCCKVPIEIVHALGLIPIRIGISAEEKMATGKEYTHQYTCPYIKCIVGEMLEQGDFFHDNVDIISGYVTCLAVHRCLEVLKQYTGKPTFYLTHPLNPPTEKEKKFYEGEITHFVSQLEAVTGRKLETNRLKESVELFNKIRENLKELYRLQSLNGFPLKWSEVSGLFRQGFYWMQINICPSLMRPLRKRKPKKQSFRAQMVHGESCSLALLYCPVITC
jgi:benzoyl-CoA reductase/2-hydroxyglutaryl-CoA dehydratase subunit BcrC/BadD/HgdB